MPLHAPPAGAPCWFELASTDPERSIAFARAVFGWSAETQATPTGPYTFMANGSGPAGAICGLPPGAEGTPSFWGVYFLVADLDAARSRALALGATPFDDPFDVPGMGRGAVLADPGGAFFSLWQPDPAAGSELALFEPFSVGWVELATRDVDAAQRFYGELLGWRFADSANAPAGTRYSEYAVGDLHYGGLLQMTPAWGDLPAHWSIYVVVPDLGIALSATDAAGGTVTVPAFDAPGVGRIARVDDPTGAGLYLVELLGP
jgi:predicted enzyme related to lactoylglutathione lyase